MRTSTAVFITIAVLTTAGPGWAQSGQVQAKEIPASNPVRSRIHQKSPEPPHTTTDFASNEHLEMEAQLAGFASMRRISFQDFMAPIEESNLDFATQRDSVAIARAQSTASLCMRIQRSRQGTAATYRIIGKRLSTLEVSLKRSC